MTQLDDATTDELVCAIPQLRLPNAELPPEIAEQARQQGTEAFLGQFGHVPGLIQSWLAWYQPLMVGGVVPTRTKELCRLAVARRTGCEMCQQGRFPDPLGGGQAVSETDAADVLADRWDGFTPAEQAALAYTVAFWDDHMNVPDDVIGAATDALGYGGFIEVAVMVAQFSGMGRLFHMLGLPGIKPGQG